MKSRNEKRLEEREVKKIFKPILESVKNLHGNNISHRDIKLENIMIDINLKPYLIDFGFSIYNKNASKLNLFCGTPSYMSPEIASKKEYYGPPSDIWSLGIMLYAMISGYMPFKGTNEADLYKKIIKGNINYPIFMSQAARILISKMLSPDPDKRPKIEEVINKKDS